MYYYYYHNKRVSMLVTLFCSCHMFLANSIYAYYLNNWYISIVVFFVYLGSAFHYLTYTEASIYHYIDVCMSRSSVVLLIPYSTLYVHHHYSIMALNNVVLSYGVSRCVYWMYPGDFTWIWFHVYFHTITNYCIYVCSLNYKSMRERGISLHR